MDNTSISTPKGAVRQQRKVDDFKEYVDEGIHFVRQQVIERVLNPDSLSYEYRSLLLNIIGAKTV